jgi:hypothetical protein
MTEAQTIKKAIEGRTLNLLLDKEESLTLFLTYSILYTITHI